MTSAGMGGWSRMLSPVWVSIITRLKACMEQKVEEGGIHPFFLPYCMSWDISLLLLLPLDWDEHHQLPDSQAHELRLNYLAGFPRSQACRYLLLVLFLWKSLSNTEFSLCPLSTCSSIRKSDTPMSRSNKDYISSWACSYVPMRKQGWFLFKYEIWSNNFIKIFVKWLYIFSLIT